jgi:quercetin dioxygenase-like cupin family protein
MAKTDLRLFAASLPTAWRSAVVGQPGGANFKVVRMDRSGYPEEVHAFDEALLVLDGQMNLKVQGSIVNVAAGEVFIVPAGLPHAVAPESSGTLIIIDAVQQ